MEKDVKKFNLEVIEVIDNGDNTCTVVFDLKEDFIQWFKEKYNLKRFSRKKFEKMVIESLKSVEKEDILNMEKENDQ